MCLTCVENVHAGSREPSSPYYKYLIVDREEALLSHSILSGACSMSSTFYRAEPFVFGGLASITAECGTFPVDTTKTRLQIQGQIGDKSCRDVRYRGMTHALTKIYGEEGLGALYRGIAPALLRQASYGTLKIGLYNVFKQKLKSYSKRESLHSNMICGVTSGAIGSAIANPTDVLKVRMQSATCDRYTKPESVFCAFNRIYKQEGIRGLYRGVWPTAQRAGLVAGILLPFYDFFKKHLLATSLFEDNSVTHLTSGFLAGLIGVMVTNPIDVVKSRMMNQTVLLKNGNKSHIYTGSMDCLIRTIGTEGPRALYKGIIPSYLRLGPWNIIFFVTYERLKVFFD